MSRWNMFGIGILIGIYSYAIFILGILGILNNLTITITTVIFLFSLIYLLLPFFKNFISTKYIFRKRVFVLILLITSLMLVNLVGVFGPELAFDALWYHLTLPKIFLQNNSIFFIDGGLFYYSVMPKLIDLLYIPGILYFEEIGPKLIHYTFGILTSLVLYKFSRKFFDVKISLLAVLIFYSNLVVSWQSITAYIDLGRTFYELLALFGFINWFETKDKKWLIISAIVLGLAFSTKLIALGSLFIFVVLIIYIAYLQKKELSFLIKSVSKFIIVSLAIVLPWFIFAYLYTGNPIYPVFSKFYGIEQDFLIQLNPINLFKSLFILFTKSADPISPIYIIFLPLILFVYKRFDKRLFIILIYSVLAVVLWLLTPNTGGGRFIMPYLPAFSILSVAVIVNISWFSLKKYLIALVIFIALITIFYRGLANYKYIPFVLGNETKGEFLSNNLNFKFGDFYDIDDWFSNNIKEEDTVLLYGFHNLYYIDFPFIHESYLKESDEFNYVATQNTIIPNKFKNWILVYENEATNVKVYKRKD